MQNKPVLYLVIIVSIAAIAFVIYSAIKRREEVFEGEVIDKDIIENQAVNNYGNSAANRPGTIMLGNTGGVTHSYRIKVKTDQGKTINYKISEGKYEIIKIGDRVSKPKGTTEVSILSSKSNDVNINPTPPPNTSNTINPNPPQPLS